MRRVRVAESLDALLAGLFAQEQAPITFPSRVADDCPFFRPDRYLRAWYEGKSGRPRRVVTHRNCRPTRSIRHTICAGVAASPLWTGYSFLVDPENMT
jgi:hypothetical protein